MTTRNEQETRPNEGTGLGHSTPLVTIPAAPVVSGVRPFVSQTSISSASTSTSVSATDHPLAVSTSQASDVSVSNTAAAVVRGVDVELPDRTTVASHPLATPLPAASSPAPAKQFPRPAAAVPAIVVSSPVSPSKTLDDLADAFLSGKSARIEQGLQPILQPEPIPADVTDLERLRLLVKQRAWGDVIPLTERLLRGQSSHYAPIYASLLNNTAGQGLPTLDSQQADLVWIMTVQCQAWLKMQRYSDLGLEVEQWGFCHHNDNNAPSWIPWSLHILAAWSLLYSCEDPSSNTAVDALWALCSDIPDDNAIAKLQVEHALANAFIRRRDWRMALLSQQRMLDVLPAACRERAQQYTDSDSIERAYKCEILSRQGRILIQLGAIHEASQIFQKASAEWKDLPLETVGPTRKDSIVLNTPAQLAVNEGLLCFSYAKYEEALEFFRQAAKLIRESGALSSQPSLDDRSALLPVGLGIAPANALYSETINNMSLCALYTCRLKEALFMMESLVREDPVCFLTERVALNLCTLYELSNETSVSARKKRVLQLIAKRFSLHDISTESFRL